ncbi:Acetylcholinesterase [Aphelenchoides fujianensis]|nr:Acetylcholinesterase [Aphelenchoides fujianensis]
MTKERIGSNDPLTARKHTNLFASNSNAGLPFAEPPTGERRFGAPEAKRSWSDELDATESRPPCAQRTPAGHPPVESSEDCLFVDVIAGRRCVERQAECATVFFVHGGEFAAGGPQLLNETKIAELFAQHDVIFVAPAYRLGVFGWLDLGEDLRAAPFNAGLMGEFESVQRISLLGHEAGAELAAALLASPAVERTAFQTAVFSDLVPDLQAERSRAASMLVADHLGNESCPVIFYVHGGGFYFDAPNDIVEKLAGHRTVFVMPAYRLGIFGFFDLGSPQADAPYNAGLLDLVTAVRWCQQELPNFGGDPLRMTAFGNSAGAALEMALLSSPFIEKRAFRGAIVSSGMINITPHLSRAMTLAVVDRVGCGYNGTAELSYTQAVACLRRKSTDELLDAMFATELKEWRTLGPQPDADFINAQNVAEFLDTWRGLPIVVITTADEFRFRQPADGRGEVPADDEGLRLS